MTDGRPRFGKETVEKDDGRYLILYTFDEPKERDGDTSSKVAGENTREERSEA